MRREMKSIRSLLSLPGGIARKTLAHVLLPRLVDVQLTTQVVRNAAPNEATSRTSCTGKSSSTITSDQMKSTLRAEK